MKVTLWGTRGSLPSPGPETARYGGNTSCLQVVGSDGTLLVLDAGTGIRRLGMNVPDSQRQVHILLTHLHLDHVQGLGFFRPLDDPDFEVHIWGPRSATRNLRTRLSRYLSPPLFPIHLRDLPCTLVLHDIGSAQFSIGEFAITSAMVCHPGPTLGYRIASQGAVLTYLPDHEPPLGQTRPRAHLYPDRATSSSPHGQATRFSGWLSFPQSGQDAHHAFGID